MEKALGDRFREMMKQSNLRINMTQLSEITGVSPSQIRYWEKKGYIKSEQSEKNQNHFYPITMIYQVGTIKFFLDQGFTLTMAVKKEKEHRESIKLFREFITSRRLDIKQIGPHKGEIELGAVAEDPDTEVYATIEDGKTELHLRTKKNI